MKNIPDISSIIIGNDYLNHFCLMDNFSAKYAITSTLELLDSDNKSYVFLDFSFRTLNIFYNKVDSITDKKSLNISFKSILNERFKGFTQKQATEDFVEQLFKYTTNIEIYNWMLSDQLNTVDFEELEYYNINVGINNVLKISLYDYFETIVSVVNQFVKKHFKDQKIFFKSPFTNFQHISAFNKNTDITFLNEFEFLSQKVSKSNSHLLKVSDYNLNLNQKTLSKSWVLLNQIQNRISLTGKKDVVEIPFLNIFEELKDSYFQIKQSTYLKLFIETQTNFLNQSCLKITTINNKIFYKVI
ncbi:hypothetical protein H2O64_14995 [Kordia sp. YSTF-M3]|uniref:Uncharacterized protein n=1 Tax=Kordia aestuariivivens TaxID=2759037 RepID=A0ABR7QBX4_9FLAO|nr:hypothetical protein [Kordia aestuariivivens]MBC8755983.1 hypothetical protein [Kordia aestuariivivens]